MKLGGWTRLGIVVSSIWLAMAIYLGYSELSSLYGTRKYEVAKDGIGTATYVFSAAQSDSEIQSTIKDDLIPEFEAHPEEHRGRELRDPYEKYVAKHAPSTIRSAVAVALVPVLAIFAVGWAIAWVRSGFRQHKSA